MDRREEGPCFAWLAVSVLLVAACTERGSDEHEATHAPHGPEEKSDSIIVWGERHEVFIEHPFLVRAKPARFIAHITYLDGYEPRRTGPITLVLKSGADTVLVEADQPKRDGLYVAEATLPTSGEWEFAIRIPEEDRLHEIRLPTRWVFDGQEEADLVVAPEAGEGTRFLKEQQWSLRFGTAPVERRTLTQRIRLPGVVAARPKARALVHPAVAGQLAAHEDRPLPTTGQRIEQGAVLAVVRPPVTSNDILSLASNQQARLALRQQIEAMAFERRTLEAELQVKLAETRASEVSNRVDFEHARADLERTRDLHSRSARTDVQLIEAQQRVERAQAQLDAAAALEAAYATAIEKLASILETSQLPMPSGEIELPTFELIAPISGTVLSVEAVLGQHILPEDHIFTIVDAGLVLVKARIPESELGRVGESPGALYEVPGRRGEFRSIAEAGGRFVRIGLEVDPRTRTVDLVYEVPNDGSLRLGMALDLLVETSVARESLVVPASAVVNESGLEVVFVMTGGEMFAKRYVDIGIEDGSMVQILAGLAEGDRVVTVGAFAVRLASAATSIPAHGHAH